FAQHDSVDQGRHVGRAFAGDESRGLSGLFGIVLNEVTHQDVGVDSDHRRHVRLRMAASISSSVTRRGAGASSPFNSLTSTLAGIRTTLPSDSTINSIRSPFLSLRCRRITPGMVV